MVLKEEVLSPSGFDSLEQCKVNTLLDKVGQICSGSETPRRKVNICLIGPGVNESVLNGLFIAPRIRQQKKKKKKKRKKKKKDANNCVVVL
jgi:hypothetical protein